MNCLVSFPKPTSPLAAKQEERPVELAKPAVATTPVSSKDVPKKPLVIQGKLVF